jgi:hypothetical protein
MESRIFLLRSSQSAYNDEECISSRHCEGLPEAIQIFRYFWIASLRSQ